MKGATDSLQKTTDSYDQDYGVLLLNLIKKFEGIYEYFGFSFQLTYFFISQEIFWIIAKFKFIDPIIYYENQKLNDIKRWF